jgi:hypothetical protein
VHQTNGKHAHRDLTPVQWEPNAIGTQTRWDSGMLINYTVSQEQCQSNTMGIKNDVYQIQ